MNALTYFFPFHCILCCVEATGWILRVWEGNLQKCLGGSEPSGRCATCRLKGSRRVQVWPWQAPDVAILKHTCMFYALTWC